MLHYEFLAAWARAQAKTERGASLVEYALLVALIAVVCIAAVTLLGESASEKFSQVDSSINGAGSCSSAPHRDQRDFDSV